MAVKVDDSAGRSDASYGEGDITVLEGLEAVRKRPGHVHRLDRPDRPAPPGVGGRRQLGRRGHGRAVHPDRRHPAGRRRLPGQRRRRRASRSARTPSTPSSSAAEIVLTTLHAGGKFGGKGYQVSGGLHGVGVSVVNALSTRLVLEIDRDGQHWEAEFAKGGKVKRKIAATGPAPTTAAPASRAPAPPSPSGPTPPIFDEIEFRAQTIIERLQIMAFLNKGLEIRFVDERPDPEHQDDLQVQRRHRRLRQAPQRVEGVAVPQGRRPSSRPRRARRSRSRCSGTPATTSRSTPSPTASPPSRAACTSRASPRPLTNVVNRYARARNLLKEKEENLKGEDIREGLTAIISVRLRDPQFEGQTKAKLGNVTIRSLVERATNEKLAEWLEENPREAQPDRAEVDAGGAGPGGGAGAPAT